MGRDICAAQRGKLRSASLHRQGELLSESIPDVLQPHPVRQRIKEHGLAEPSALDFETGQRGVLVFNQGGLQDERGGLNFRPIETKLSGKFQYTFRFNTDGGRPSSTGELEDKSDAIIEALLQASSLWLPYDERIGTSQSR